MCWRWVAQRFVRLVFVPRMWLSCGCGHGKEIIFGASFWSGLESLARATFPFLCDKKMFLFFSIFMRNRHGMVSYAAEKHFHVICIFL